MQFAVVDAKTHEAKFIAQRDGTSASTGDGSAKDVAHLVRRADSPFVHGRGCQ